ncbi:hypothetical protein N665_7110s0002 [Sinapis alba]|nr:hypothetical protein N665_7110s0002 [Sinapis alba]
MKLLTIFIFVLATYYRFGTACKDNRVVIINQLGPGILLTYDCYYKNPDIHAGKYTLKFNKWHDMEFQDASITFVKKTITCNFKYDKYYYDFRAYREAAFGRCGALRSYAARKDGIYFRRSYQKPWEFKFHWNVGK